MNALRPDPSGPPACSARPPNPPRLLDRVREAIRLRHYSPRTEDAYVGWIRRFIFFHGVRHPAEMGAAEINHFLTDLAVTATSVPQPRTRRSLLCCFSTKRSCRSPWNRFKASCGPTGPAGCRWSLAGKRSGWFLLPWTACRC